MGKEREGGRDSEGEGEGESLTPFSLSVLIIKTFSFNINQYSIGQNPSLAHRNFNFDKGRRQLLFSPLQHLSKKRNKSDLYEIAVASSVGCMS